MKRILIAIMAGIMLTASVPATAVSHHRRHSANTTTYVAKSKDTVKTAAHAKDTTAMVAFSDTTDTANVADSLSQAMNMHITTTSPKDVKEILAEALVPVCVIAITCFLAPVGIVALIVYLIVKSRQQKIKLAELAQNGGQPIPDDLLGNNSSVHPKKKLWEKGILKIFLGAGIAVMCMFLDFSLGIGIGFLVAFYGCGQFFIDYWGNKRKKEGDVDNADVSDAE